MKTKIKTKTIVSLISLSFFMLMISALPVKAMANPASEYCVGVGGTLEIRAQEDGGQYGVCIFSDGSECEEWALYNGDCQKGLINDEIKDENVKKQIVNIEKIQRIYNKLNKLSEQGLDENIDKAKRMAEFDQGVSVNDLGIKKSGNLLNQISTFILLKKESGVEQIGTLPDSKLYPFKEISRKVKMAFTFNPIKKVELQQRFANEKLMEAKKVYEKNKNPEQAEKLLEKYSEETELISKRIEKIKRSPKNQAGIDNLLDNLADHLIKRQKAIQELKEKLEKQLPSQAYEKVEANLNRTIKNLGRSIERLEGNKELLKERFVKIAEQQEGSEFKNFKNLEILKEIEEKMSSKTSEAIKEARKTIKEKFIQDMSKANTETRMNFQNYLGKTKGNSIRHLEIVKEIELEEIPPEVRVEIEKAKEKAVEKIEKEMKKMKSKQQRENFLKVLKNPEIEKLRVIKELEDNLPLEFLAEMKKIKKENIGLIQKKIKNNSAEQKEFIEKAKQFHDVSQFEILEEIGMNVNGKIKQVINKAVDRTYKEFKKDIERAENEKNKRKILEKLITGQPNHIEVLNRVQEKLESKLPSQSKAPEVFERVMKIQIEKINNRIENIDNQVKVEKIKKQIQNNEEIRKEIESRIPDFRKRIEARKNLIKKYRPIIKKTPLKKVCKDLCGDGICQTIVCLAVGCPCAETAESCPEDCSGVKNCIGDGEIYSDPSDADDRKGECCAGLQKISSGCWDGIYYCTSEICGNGECKSLENKSNCPEDCKEKQSCQDNFDCPVKMKCENNTCVSVGCVKEGDQLPGVWPPEHVKHMATECCAGLEEIGYAGYYDETCNTGPGPVAMSAGGPGGTCANCGNGICGLGETRCNCPEDCK